MRLVIDALYMRSPGGLALRRELALATAKQSPAGSDVVLVVNSRFGADVADVDNLRVLRVEPLSDGWLGRCQWYGRVLPSMIRDLKGEAVFSMNGVVSNGLLDTAGVVATINNMLPFTPTLAGSVRLPAWAQLRLAAQRLVFSRSLKRSDAVILHSKHALERVSAFAGDISGKTIVVLTGMPGTVEFNELHPPAHPYGGKPYLLYLSTLHPYKNHLRLIESYRRALGAGIPLPDLLIAGHAADESWLAKIREAIASPSLEGRAKYLGVLPQCNLGAWFHHATVNVFPSLCETNSVVLAETLGAHGVLACSDCAPMPEIAGDGAVYFDPYNPDSIVGVVRRLCADDLWRAELRRMAALRAEQFSWSACGDAVWQGAAMAVEAFDRRKVRCL